MSDEAEFLRQLEATPGDETLRLVYADWLQDHGRGDEAARQRKMAPGYRALVQLQLEPWHDTDNGPWTLESEATECWCWWGSTPDCALNQYRLPDDWFIAVKGHVSLYLAIDVGGGETRSKDFLTLKSAMDAAALAFAELPEAVRDELLATEVGA